MGRVGGAGAVRRFLRRTANRRTEKPFEIRFRILEGPEWPTIRH
jgi:hypothetical protein